MVDRKVICSIVPVPDIEHQDALEMSQAEYAAVDWGTSSFRLWLIDRAGHVLQERRSQEGMMAAAKLDFAAVLQSHLDDVGAANLRL
jgi:2-keto-3-deoxy-galactonokinase